MANRRKSMTPYHLELILFLLMTKDLWNAKDMQDILDELGALAQAAKPVAVDVPAAVVEVQEEVDMYVIYLFHASSYCIFMHLNTIIIGNNQ